MKIHIVLGDMMSHDDTMITAYTSSTIDGNPISRVNDKVVCSKYNGTFPIPSRDTACTIDGPPATHIAIKLCAVRPDCDSGNDFR